jgi:hypothetical protein
MKLRLGENSVGQVESLHCVRIHLIGITGNPVKEQGGDHKGPQRLNINFY